MCSLLSRNVFVAGRLLRKSSQVYTCPVIDLNHFNPKRQYSIENKTKKLDNKGDQVNEIKHNLAAAVKTEYEVFRDEDSEIILDVDEEKKRIDLETLTAIETKTDPYEGLNMKRGIRGVFDIEDLVELLRKDKALNIFVTKVPAELSYVDYIVIVTGKSVRHMTALATFIRKAYKLKCHPRDILPKIEGAKSKDWIALDLGNIALHIFSTEAREEYDLETLWAIGSKYDSLSNEENLECVFADKYNKFLAGLRTPGESSLAGFQPADEPNLATKSI